MLQVRACKMNVLQPACTLAAILIGLIGLVTGQIPLAGQQSTASATLTRNSTLGTLNPPLFMPAVHYDSGGFEALDVVVADMNGDGKPDLVVRNVRYSWVCTSPFCSTGNVGVLLGNGDGTFQPALTYTSGEPAVIYNFDSGEPGFAVADVNGDARPDVIVASGSEVRVLLGIGDGTLRASVSYVSGGYGASSVVIADVDGDAKPDLIVANRLGGVGVLLGNGDGTFQAAVMYDSGHEQGYSVAVADVNGDGKLDVVVGNRCVSSPHSCADLAAILLGNGDGTFQPAVTYDTGEGFQSWIGVADVNGDGHPDLVCANPNSVAIGIMLGNGDGTFKTSSMYRLSGGDYPRSVAVADVNGDGKPDLVVGIAFDGMDSTGVVNVFLGNGDDRFHMSTYLSGGSQTMFSIEVADLNNDGKPDIVVPLCGDSAPCGYQVDGAVAVLLNNTPFCTTAPTVAISATPNFLWPPNGRMVPVAFSGTITNTQTGCSIQNAAYAVKDEYNKVQPSGPLTLGLGGAFLFTVPLQASRLGSDLNGRQYTVTVGASGNAGMTGSQSETVIVPHDRGR